MAIKRENVKYQNILLLPKCFQKVLVWVCMLERTYLPLFRRGSNTSTDNGNIRARWSGLGPSAYTVSEKHGNGIGLNLIFKYKQADLQFVISVMFTLSHILIQFEASDENDF